MQLNLDWHGFGGRGVSGEEVRSSSVTDQTSMSPRCRGHGLPPASKWYQDHWAKPLGGS